MISMSELLGSHNIADVSHSDQLNLEELKKRINAFRDVYGKPMQVTSGYRFLQDHLRIYSEKGISRDKIPMGSAHLKGCAVDISDKDGSLMKYCRDNVPLLEKIGLWVEDDPSTPRVHFQTYPPKSGNRFFKP